MTALQYEVNRLFNSMFDSPTGVARSRAIRRWAPAMDLIETPESFILRADLPGLSHEDVTIELEDNVLTVAGERKFREEHKDHGYRRMERAYGSFSRALTLPDGVDPATITASFVNGVLEVTVPKPEQKKPVRVAIDVGGAKEEPSAIEGEAKAA